jgi:hypothetical protein
MKDSFFKAQFYLSMLNNAFQRGSHVERSHSRWMDTLFSVLWYFIIYWRYCRFVAFEFLVPLHLIVVKNLGQNQAQNRPYV